MGFGRGSRAGQLRSLWPGLPQPQPPIAHGCGETSQTSSGVCQGQMAEPRAAAAGKAADVQESGTGKTERLLPTGQPSPEISSLPGVRLVLTSSMSFLSLECCVSGLTRALPSMSLPSCWGQSAFCLAVSLCKKPEVGLRNKTEGREGGKMASSTLRSCGTKKPLLGKKGFIKRLGSCEHVCLTEVKEDQRQAWTSLRTHRDSLRTLV